MQHYWCQSVYITATASERIVDTLDFFPHNSPMPQMSSTERILMAAQDMTDALKHPHPDIPFSTIGHNNSISNLVGDLRRKVPKTGGKQLTTVTARNAANTRQESELQPVITSPIRHCHQTRTETNAKKTFENVQQPPRVVTPATKHAAPPRVQARPYQLSPRNLSRDFLDLGGANCAIAFCEDHWTKTHMMNSVIHPITGKEM
jgi:hypothetical protein